MKKRCVAALIISLTIMGCQKQENKEISPLKEPLTSDQNIKENAVLETFDFPSEIEGCGCYFAKNEEDLNSEKYVYVDEIEGKTYFKIGEDLLQIQKSDDEINLNQLSKTIEDQNYKITLNGNRIKKDQEALLYKGVLKVLDKKTGKKLESSIIGECGC